MKNVVSQEEIIYYELVKMEERLTKKAEAVLEAREEIEGFLKKFELIAKDLIGKMEKCNEK